VVFLLLKKFNSELETEVEVFLMLLIRLANEEADADHRRPHWLRVLAMEVIRGLVYHHRTMFSFAYSIFTDCQATQNLCAMFGRDMMLDSQMQLMC